MYLLVLVRISARLLYASNVNLMLSECGDFLWKHVMYPVILLGQNIANLLTIFLVWLQPKEI